MITYTEQYSLYEHEYLSAIADNEAAGWAVRQVLVIQSQVLVVFERPTATNPALQISAI